MNSVEGVASKTPFVAVPPASGREDAPLVIVWHMLDAPRNEVAMSAALPLKDVDAWRVYLGLPVPTELADPVLGFFGPIVADAVADFPQALAELRRQLPAGEGPIRLVGASISAMVALSLVAEAEGIPVASVAVISPATTISGLIQVNEQAMGMTYPWSDESRAVAHKYDFVARAGELTKRAVPVLLVIGQDDVEGFARPAEKLWQALSSAGDAGRYSLVTVPGMSHALAEEPGVQAAQQTAHAARVDSIVSDWFNRA